MPEIRQKLRPFGTPNFVIVETPPRPRQEGFHPAPSIPLSEVPAEVLAALCDEFRAEVFAKAGKIDPRATRTSLVRARTPRPAPDHA